MSIDPPVDTATLDAPDGHGGDGPSLAEGSRFAERYEILGELGRGAMGVVFRARDELLGEEVALKVLNHLGGGTTERPELLERFRREVRLARRISHPNVARTHDLGESNGTFYLTMELVEGESLGERLGRLGAGAHLPVLEVIEIGRAMADGLAAAHQSGVVHCDLKPDNVMLDRATNRVVVTDFGIARALSERDAAQGRIAGTPGYMAPEQLEGRASDARSDLYALGVVLYECLTGTLPFSGPTPMAIGLARLTEPARPLPPRADLPQALIDLVSSLLRRDPATRPAGADEVAQRLGRIARGEVAELDEVAALFRAGRHQEVLLRTFDGAEASTSPEHMPYVVGSLALLGRLDEALALAASFERDPRSSVAVPVRFFALVGLVHSGRYDEARRWARKNAAAARDPDPTVRFYAFQGIALLRYFTGRVGLARLSARRALKEAVQARFSYGRLLALDLSGHVLVQRGEVSAGLRVLEQAERLAASLGAPGHRTSIECARLSYENRHGRASEDLEGALSRVAASSGDNLYALRAAWLELAFRSALLGDAVRGRDALERAREQALPERDHRARARLFLVEAILSRLDGSMDAVRAAIREAAAALDRGDDRGLRTELLVWDRVLGAGCFPIDLVHATKLRNESQTLIAEVLVTLAGGPPLTAGQESETPLYALLTARREGETRAQLAVQRGWLGVVPLLFAPRPGRYLFFLGDALLTADRGTVSEQERLPGHAKEILEALRDGPRAKEDLVREVWRVARYAAQLHDPVVHTAIARLRRAMGGSADWLETTAQGYALRADVEMVVLEVALTEKRRTEPPMDGAQAQASTAPIAASPSIADVRAKQAPAPRIGEVDADLEVTAPEDPLLTRLKGALVDRSLRSAELAERLSVSEATVLRRLRILVAEGAVIREGVGKRTKYRRA